METKTTETSTVVVADDAQADFSAAHASVKLTAVAAASALVLAACGGGGDAAAPDAGASAASQALASSSLSSAEVITDAAAARFLQQASFASSAEDITALKSIGYGGWWEREVNKPITQTYVSWLQAQGWGTDPNNRFGGLSNVIWAKLIGSGDGLRQKIAYVLSQYFVVSAIGLNMRYGQFALGFYMDTLEKHAFGNFRDLLEAVTLSPAMGQYLTYRGNKKENPVKGSFPDENYAREILQLFSIGLWQLNQDGTQKLGENGEPIPTYSNDDILGLAKVFTGWTFTRDSLPEVIRPMRFFAALHSNSEKRFLGSSIAANTSGQQSLKLALDTIFMHPNVAPFFCKQMIQRLVTSNPSKAYVNDIAAVFNNNGKGLRGDLKAVFKAILLHPQASMAPSTSSGKLREPIARFLQWARTFKVNSPTGKWVALTTQSPLALGQMPLASPSVFNFYRPGYVPPNTSIANWQLVAPEFQITNESTVVAYVNFMQQRIRQGLGSGVMPDYRQEIAMASTPQRLVEHLNLVLAAMRLPKEKTDAIVQTINSMSGRTEVALKNRVYAAILLVMCAPEYLVQQ